MIYKTPSLLTLTNDLSIQKLKHKNHNVTENIQTVCRVDRINLYFKTKKTMSSQRNRYKNKTFSN